MKISICQINPVIGDFEHNVAIIKKSIVLARESGCDLAIFPEMSLMGYPPKDLLEKPGFIKENFRQLEKLASDIKDISVLCGYVDINPMKTGKPLINSAALITDGKILGKGGKRLLPTYDVFDEARYFDPASESLVFDLAGERIGVTICEDIWSAYGLGGILKYHIDPVKDIAGKKIDILVNISASPYELNKESQRLNILKEISLTYGITSIYCNQTGGNDDLLFDGASMVVDRRGQLVLMGSQFEPDQLLWDSERDYDEISGDTGPVEDTILKALIMGTGDYVKKCGFSKVLVGLSGGIDSTLVACIAASALGPENVMGISMPSPYTSEMSRNDAKALTENLGIHFDEIPITRLFETYKETLSKLFKGLPENETEENIQARIRGNLLMALSNKFNALLLTTGNKSELAMGYCTLYGDMSGGLAVISDIPKTMCYRLADYINREREIIPQRIITRPPSAELRFDQTDQDSLPPYHVLDEILEAAVEKKLSVEDIAKMGHDYSLVKDIVKRLVFNEYKRRQAPPGLKITSKAFGAGRRYPIARGRQVY